MKPVLIEDAETFQRRGMRVFGAALCVLRLLVAVLFFIIFREAAFYVLAFAINAAVMTLLVRKLSINLLILIFGFEGAIFASGLHYYFGPVPGLELLALWAVFSVFLFEHLSLRLRVLMAIFPLLLHLALEVPLDNVQPIYQLEEYQLLIFRNANLFTFVMITFAIMSYFAVRVQKQKAFAEQQAEERRYLIAALSHELKTPIAAMMARTQLTMENAERKAGDNKLLDTLERNLRGMGRLVRRMLEYSRLESASGLFTHEKQLDLGQVIGECVELHAPIADAKKVTCEVDCEDGLSILADLDLLQLILNNLLGNAIRHSHPDGLVSISAESSGDRIVIRIRDQGEGISDEDVERIFQPFFRADRARARDHDSHGLGLNLVKEAVEQMGGSIEVSSKIGEGSEFSVRL